LNTIIIKCIERVGGHDITSYVYWKTDVGAKGPLIQKVAGQEAQVEIVSNPLRRALKLGQYGSHDASSTGRCNGG
jgi:hypothetical protein